MSFRGIIKFQLSIVLLAALTEGLVADGAHDVAQLLREQRPHPRGPGLGGVGVHLRAVQSPAVGALEL